jgi:tagatose 1,6-diphosphate aldolase
MAAKLKEFDQHYNHRLEELRVKATIGKYAGITKVSNEKAVIAAVAVDQRGSLKKMLVADGRVNVVDQDLDEIKTIVTDVLTPHASAILLDPEFGLDALQHRHGKGLFLGYEKTGYDNNVPGRIPEVLEHWSARRLVEAGADCVKVLLYYSPYEQQEVNDRKHVWVERIGDECRALDVPYFVETVGYDVAGHGEASVEYARLKPSVVKASMVEFSKPRYGVDVLKVEIPVSMKHVSDTRSFAGDAAYSKSEALDRFREQTSVTGLPFIYLSAGVPISEFTESLELANEAKSGYSGVLCGRAIWKEGIPVFAQQGPAAFRDWIGKTGLEYLARVNALLAAARPWTNRVERPEAQQRD